MKTGLGNYSIPIGAIKYVPTIASRFKHAAVSEIGHFVSAGEQHGLRAEPPCNTRQNGTKIAMITASIEPFADKEWMTMINPLAFMSHKRRLCPAVLIVPCAPLMPVPTPAVATTTAETGDSFRYVWKARVASVIGLCALIRALFRPLAVVLLLALPGPAAGETTAPATPTYYSGGYGTPGNFIYTIINFETGKIEQPFDRTDEPPFRNLTVRNGQLRFDADRLHFELTQFELGAGGWVTDEKGKRRPAYFRTRPKDIPSLEVLERYEGTYRIGQRRLLTLSRSNFSSLFHYLELPSGRTGALFYLPNGELTGGPCMYCPGPEYLRVSLDPRQSGRAQHVRVTINGRTIDAPRIETHSDEEIRFISKDGTQLAGLLLLPSGKAPHPAVVFAHGSNAQTRNGFHGNIRFIAEAYARSGIAALIFDKRGTGRSKGDWEIANFEILADDVAAGVEFLKTRAEIRADRIGLTGSSQAGWIMSWASMRVPDVRFIQMRSSSPMSVREANRDQLVLMMEAERYPRSEIQRALDIRDMMDDYAVTGRNWEQLEAAAKQVENEYWMTQFIGGLPAKDSPDHAWLRKAFSYDTTAAVRNFRGAWQAIYGASDTVVSVPKTRAWFEDALRYGRSNDVTIEVVPNADHNYYETKTGLDHRELPGYSRYIPGIFDKTTRWANERMRNTYTHPLSPGKTPSR